MVDLYTHPLLNRISVPMSDLHMALFQDSFKSFITKAKQYSKKSFLKEKVVNLFAFFRKLSLNNYFEYIFKSTVFPYVFLALLILTFYWSPVFMLVVPTGDGAMPLSFYSYLYSGYLTYGKYLFWNPFLLGGAINNLIVSFNFGLSPFNPLIHIWFFISKTLNIEILRSFYLYYLFHIYISSLFIYKLGKEYLFKNNTVSIMLAAIYSVSGLFVSSFGLYYPIFQYSWLFVSLYFGIRALSQNKYIDYFLFAFSLSIFGVGSPVTVLPGLAFIFVFLLTFFIFTNLKKDFSTLFGLYFKKSILFLVFLSVFITPPLAHWLMFTKVSGYHPTGDPATFFFGRYDDPPVTNFSTDFYVLCNTFIPSDKLGSLFDYGSKGLWYNSFYYLGCVSPVLIFFGIKHLLKKSELHGFLYSLCSSFLLILVYSYNHPVLTRTNHKLELLFKYPKFSMPLIIFVLVIMVGFGLQYVFENIKNGTSRPKLIKDFLIGLLLINLFSCIALTSFSVFSGTLAIKQQLVVLPNLVLSSLFYTLFFSILYFASLNTGNIHVFFLVLLLDIFFFLTPSTPLTSFPLESTEGNFNVKMINSKVKMRVPHTFNYSGQTEYIGMHFGVGPTLYRETAIPRPSSGLMNERLAYWTELNMDDDWKEPLDSYFALSMLGVSRSRYFLANSFYFVNNYEDVYPSLKDIYTSYYKKDGKVPVDFDPIVLSKNGTKFMPYVKFKDPSSIPLVFTNQSDYVNGVLSDKNSFNESMRLLAKDFIVVWKDTRNSTQQVSKYNIPLSASKNSLTENNFAENLCILVFDGTDYYYPVSNDIFNFLPHYPGSDYRYIVNYRKFYATYLNRDGTMSLYVRNDIGPVDLQIIRDESCSKPSDIFVTKNTVLVDKKDLIFKKFESGNNHNVFYTNKLAYLGVPSYIGDYIDRTEVMSHSNRKHLKMGNTKDIESLKNENFYTLSNRMFKIYKSFKIDPFINDSYDISWTEVSEPTFGKELEILKETPDEVTFKVSATDKKMLIVRDVYSDDWKAFIDGKRTDIYLVNGLYMGIYVPDKGNDCEISLKYQPDFVYIPSRVLPVIGVLIPVAYYMTDFVKKRKNINS